MPRHATALLTLMQIYLNYVLFMETYVSEQFRSHICMLLTAVCRLVREAAIHSKQSGERSLAARSVKKVTRVRTHSRLSRVNGLIKAISGYSEQVQRMMGRLLGLDSSSHS